jgi:hypothetical protein
MTSGKAYETEQRLNALTAGSPWMSATAINGWGGPVMYRLSMDQRSVKVSSAGSIGVGTSGNGTFICQPLAGVPWPSSARWMAAGANGTSAASGTCYIRYLSDGHIDIWFGPPSGSIGFEGEFPIDF